MKVAVMTNGLKIENESENVSETEVDDEGKQKACYE